MWSGPRNISTAMMRAWGNRPDTAVIDEPFYAYYLERTGKNHPGAAEVIAAGEGKYKEDGTRQPLDVKAGDRILFGKYTGSEITLDGQELLIMREDEILGIITRAGAAAGGKKKA